MIFPSEWSQEEEGYSYSEYLSRNGLTVAEMEKMTYAPGVDYVEGYMQTSAITGGGLKSSAEEVAKADTPPIVFTNEAAEGASTFISAIGGDALYLPGVDKELLMAGGLIDIVAGWLIGAAGKWLVEMFPALPGILATFVAAWGVKQLAELIVEGTGKREAAVYVRGRLIGYGHVYPGGARKTSRIQHRMMGEGIFTRKLEFGGKGG